MENFINSNNIWSTFGIADISFLWFIRIIFIICFLLINLYLIYTTCSGIDSSSNMIDKYKGKLQPVVVVPETVKQPVEGSTDGGSKTQGQCDGQSKKIEIKWWKNLSKIIINKLNKPRKIKYMFIMPFLIKILNDNSSSNTDPMLSFHISMFALSTICLLSLINIIIYYILNHVINTDVIKKKHHILNKIITRYEKTTKIFVVMEIILCILILLFIIILNMILSGVLLTKPD